MWRDHAHFPKRFVASCMFYFASGRLLRLLRVLKLVQKLPQLHIIITALMMGLASIGYIGVILLLFFYVYAIVGVSMFRSNDRELAGWATINTYWVWDACFLFIPIRDKRNFHPVQSLDSFPRELYSMAFWKFASSNADALSMLDSRRLVGRPLHKQIWMSSIRVQWPYEHKFMVLQPKRVSTCCVRDLLLRHVHHYWSAGSLDIICWGRHDEYGKRNQQHGQEKKGRWQMRTLILPLIGYTYITLYFCTSFALYLDERGSRYGCEQFTYTSARPAILPISFRPSWSWRWWNSWNIRIEGCLSAFEIG